MAVAWFTAAEEDSVKIARSLDGGRTFQPSIDVGAGANQGRVAVTILNDSNSIVSWMGITQTKAELCVRTVDLLGNLGPVKVVAEVSKGRQSGFPRMVAQGDDAIIVWTDVGEHGPTVKAARIMTDE